MFALSMTLLFLTVNTVPATIVAVQAWEYRPARLFVFFMAAIATLNILSFVQAEATSLAMATVAAVSSGLVLVVVEILLLWLLSALFVPQWWTGTRPIIWISFPYLIAGIALGVDTIAQTRLFVDGMLLINGVYLLNIVHPGGTLFNNLFLVSWFVHLGILLVAFVRIPQARIVIGLLALTMASALIINRVVAQFDVLREIGNFVSISLLLLALAYMVMRIRFVLVTRVARDLALQSMQEAVVVLDQNGTGVYANGQAEQLGLGTQRTLTMALTEVGLDTSIADLRDSKRAGWHTDGDWSDQPPDARMTSALLTLNQRRIALTLTPVIDARQRTQGVLVMGRDMTEIEEYTTRLQEEQCHLVAAIAQLKAEQQERAQLAETVRTLSLPLIPILRGVLVLPLIGAFDSERSADFMPTLLAGIERERARLVFIDLTGIPPLDTLAAEGLLRGVQAATLLGAHCVLIGIRPDMAQALVALDIPLTGFKTAATLAQALSAELHQQRSLLPAPGQT